MSTETEKKSPLAGGSALISLMMVLVISMVLVIGAIGVVAVANGDGGAGGGGNGATTVSVTLTEFKIALDPAVVPPGKVTLQIHNAGAAEHNVAVVSLDKRIANIPAGGNATLELGNLSDSIELLCEVAGHKDSGMVATLGVSASGAGATPSTVPMTNEQMDAAMEAVAKLFPAKTEGTGNEELAPKIAADGTKEWDLEAKIVDWEVEPGKFVKGWTYNGQIPGPILRANVGDKVRINLKNSLTESTSLHLHGIRVPNSMDGVDPYTQKAIKPGETFTYEFTARETAVGMYHSHHNAQVQIPNGLAGALIIGDWKAASMRAAGNETGDTNGKAEQEVVMVLNDAGTIGLSLNGKSFPATQPYTM